MYVFVSAGCLCVYEYGRVGVTERMCMFVCLLVLCMSVDL